MNGWFEEGDRFEAPSSPGSAAEIMLNCPINIAANRALRTCKITRCALQILRDCLINCPDCPAVDSCELHEDFNQLVDQAVAGIREEWGW